MPTSAARPARSPQAIGIGHCIQRVIVERSKVEAGFAPDAVHDFRVALRRCLAIAEGFREIDPDPAWKKMRAEGKTVFSAFSELRDVQVLREWIEKIGAEAPALAAGLDASCALREQELKIRAAAALRPFSEASWLRWAADLQAGAVRFAVGGEVFQVLALERWHAARHLHTLALRNRTKVAFHRARVGIKRFRYFVENFLPQQHELWSKDLKRLQDLLGEIHDLDVLWETTCAQPEFLTVSEGEPWRRAIERERAQRMHAYRERTLGRDSVWRRWRAGLPAGEALRAAVIKRFEAWSGPLDRDKAHTGRVVKFSLTIYDALDKARLLASKTLDGIACRDLLEVAARVHEVGRSRGEGAHHKHTRRLVERLAPPPDWTAIHMRVVALVARYHRGAVPGDAHRRYKSIPHKARRAVDELAAVLRLAHAFAGRRDHPITRLRVTRQANVIAIHAAGYQERSRGAARLAAARYLLESVTGLPIFVTAAGQLTPPPVSPVPARAARQRSPA